ncbi:hypothetical protein MycrhN_2873 [Mycolicibacterium rhodesiae NBB3]|uniref:Uncharacterized protein n=1 Tax=Mycolicibacterium rhodesiae (strain NBB3) TaxID=710685 RepID=G8RJ70_MYCRN|nr:hypothetical protein [Mycolicibacterium rhodesiae]AEV73440.1 hypothetical protein MycrhN_2873 [Mycolicibacterium rhodesiae NBB3]
MATSTITFRTDRGMVAYSAMERPQPDAPGGVADGLLGGEPSLVAIVREVLAGSLPKRVRIAEPNLDYVFTDSRNTLADVAAAMLVAGNGRGRLSDAGWDALDAAMADRQARTTTAPAEPSGQPRGADPV